MGKFVRVSCRAALGVLCLSFCALVAGSNARAQLPDDQPETVHITYHVQKGHEENMKKILSEAWQAYTQQDMVAPNLHVIVQGNEGSDPYFAEIFTWRSHDIPDHMPAQVQTIWKRMNAICEKRDGKPPIDGGEVQLITPQR